MKSNLIWIWYAPWLYSKCNDNDQEVIRVDDLKLIIMKCGRCIPPTCPIKELLSGLTKKFIQNCNKRVDESKKRIIQSSKRFDETYRKIMRGLHS